MSEPSPAERRLDAAPRHPAPSQGHVVSVEAVVERMANFGIRPGTPAYIVASTWQYGNSYTNSRDICTALGIDPDAVLAADCPTCGGKGAVPGMNHSPGDLLFTCPNPDCHNGTIEVARIAIIPIDLWRRIESGEVR